MSLHHLGEQIDIHGGGNDLVFPHHENEIAQTESYTGKSFARYWVHNGMLQLSGEKMSKSLGNLVSVEDFLNEHEADVLRLMVLNSSYRSPLTFNNETIGHAESALARLRSALRPATGDKRAMTTRLPIQIQATQRGFNEAMDDDFNTAGAMGNLFDLVRSINQARDMGNSDEELADAQKLLIELTGVLGLQLVKQPETETSDVSPFIDLLLEVRQQLRTQKLWALSDQIRDQLVELDVIIEDSRDGATWRWK